MDMLRLFEKRPDHPLADPGEASRLIEGLPAERPLEALEELAQWLESLAAFDGFACDERLALAKRLDDAGRGPSSAVFAEFYARAHQRDRAQHKRFDVLHAYWEHLAAVYCRCVADNERGGKHAADIRAELPLALARAYRASFIAAKTRCLMYRGVEPRDWAELHQLLAFARVAHFEDEPARLYEREVRTTPRIELTKLIALTHAAPHELPPAQIELAARILDRFANSFEWADGRYVGAGKALGRLEELEAAAARELLSEELQFGIEFPATLIVTVARHLARYLGPNPPRRTAPRVPMPGRIEVIRGFRAICKRVSVLEGNTDDHGPRLEAELPTEPPEFWQVVERSQWGLGAELPPGVGNWTEPGMLCGVHDPGSAPWAVAVIRRLHASAGKSSCGLQILSKKPLSVWLRVLGREGQEVSHWVDSTGSLAYDYARGIVLTDAAKIDDRPVILLEAGKFVPNQQCEIMAGERSRTVRLTHFVEEGADYVKVAFDWLHATKS